MAFGAETLVTGRLGGERTAGCMGRQMDCCLDELFEESERAGLCLAPPDEPRRRALLIRERRGDLVSPSPGLYARKPFWSGLARREQALCVVRSLSRRHPGWVFCFSSAALVHGLEVSYRLLDEVHIVSTRNDVLDGVARHYEELADDEVEIVRGVPVTSLERTVFDCVRDLSFPLALAVADSAVRAGGPTVDYLVHGTRDRYHGYRNVGRFQAIAGFADGRSENGGESYARAVMIEQGVMLPELQVEITDPLDPVRSYRTDYFWELSRILHETDVAGELDGREKMESAEMLGGRTTAEAFRRERLRESRLTALGLRVARFTFGEVRRVDPLLRTLDAFGIPRTTAYDDLLGRIAPGSTCRRWAWQR